MPWFRSGHMEGQVVGYSSRFEKHHNVLSQLLGLPEPMHVGAATTAVFYSFLLFKFTARVMRLQRSILLVLKYVKHGQEERPR